MDDASIQFLSLLDKLVRALAVQGDGARATVYTVAPTSTDVASELLTMLRNAKSTDASKLEDETPLACKLCSPKRSLRTWTLGWRPVTLA